MEAGREERFLREIEELSGELVGNLLELIRIPSVNPPGENYKEIVDLLASLMEEAGLKVSVFEPPQSLLESLKLKPPRPSIVGILEAETPGKTLHLNGHYDVVPAGEGWTSNPFQPKVEGGKIFGRGAVDMKGGLASMLTALKALSKVGLPSGRVIFSVVPDEESGGLAGAGFLVEKHLPKGDAAIIGEPSGVGRISLANFGALWLEVTVHGKAAHTTMYRLGVNAVEKAASLILELSKLKRQLEKRKTRFAMSRSCETAAINVGGLISGGLRVNMLPDRCTFTIDRRLIPEETLEEAERELLQALKEAEEKDPQLKIEVKQVFSAKPVSTPETSEICLAASSAVKTILGVNPVFSGFPGFTDMRFFAEHMPAITYGPGNPEIVHSPNEHIAIKELLTAAKVYGLTTLRFLS